MAISRLEVAFHDVYSPFSNSHARLDATEAAAPNRVGRQPAGFSHPADEQRDGSETDSPLGISDDGTSRTIRFLEKIPCRNPLEQPG
jgi:hypothetical protein